MAPCPIQYMFKLTSSRSWLTWPSARNKSRNAPKGASRPPGTPRATGRFNWWGTSCQRPLSQRILAHVWSVLRARHHRGEVAPSHAHEHLGQHLRSSPLRLRGIERRYVLQSFRIPTLGVGFRKAMLWPLLTSVLSENRYARRSSRVNSGRLHRRRLGHGPPHVEQRPWRRSAYVELAVNRPTSHALQVVAGRLESATALDPGAKWIRSRLSFLRHERVRNLLSGSSLGHPLHPLLTDVPIGCWGCTLLLDLTGQVDQSTAFLTGVGIVFALPTALAGLSDWMDTEDAEMRVGSVHAVGNLIGLSCFSISWIQRRRGHRGRAASLIGLAAIGVSGWLGGHLSYALGVGVDTNAFAVGPEEWTEARLRSERESVRCVDVGGVRVAIAPLGEESYALADRCSHRGGPLSEGTVVKDCLECPWHMSRFNLRTGEVERGPASVPQPRYDVRESDSVVEIRRRERRALRRNPV